MTVTKFMIAAIVLASIAFAAGMQFRRPVYVEAYYKTDPPQGGVPFPEARAFAVKILAMDGLADRIEVYHVRAAECAWADTRMRRIFLSQDCDELYKNGALNWEVVRNIAFCIGDLLNRGDGMVTTTWQMEDEFAGWALHRLGATLEEAKSGKIGPEDKEAVERGWRKAS